MLSSIRPFDELRFYRNAFRAFIYNPFQDTLFHFLLIFRNNVLLDPFHSFFRAYHRQRIIHLFTSRSLFSIPAAVL